MKKVSYRRSSLYEQESAKIGGGGGNAARRAQLTDAAVDDGLDMNQIGLDCFAIKSIVYQTLFFAD